MTENYYEKYQIYLKKGKFPAGKPLSLKLYCKKYHNYEFVFDKPKIKITQKEDQENYTNKYEGSNWWDISNLISFEEFNLI